MIDFSSVNIEFAAQGNDEIYQNLKTLYTTVEGTVPFDPEFGININYIDEPIPIAKGRLIAEYTRKTRKFEQRASVQEVTFNIDETLGSLVPRVVIKLVD